MKPITVFNKSLFSEPLLNWLVVFTCRFFLGGTDAAQKSNEQGTR